jgi:hypothetical protein
VPYPPTTASATAATADARTLTTLNRVHLVRSLVWTAEAVLAALLLVR